jgi:Flp pilus assembly protein TadD
MRPVDMRAVALLLAALAVAGCSGSAAQEAAGDANQTLRIADAALAAGTPAVALKVLETPLAANPANTDALLRQGRAYLMMGNSAGAETSYRHALAADSHLLEARAGLGKVIMANSPAEAEKMFVEVLAAEPKNTAVLNNLGVARDLQGHHAEAQEAYHQALAITPDLNSARQNLGLSLAVSGKAEEGVTVLGPMAGNSGNDRRVRDNYAVALTLTGHTSEAGRVLGEEMNQADVNSALNGYRALYDPSTP